MKSLTAKVALVALSLAAAAFSAAQAITVVVDGNQVNFPNTSPRMVNGRVLIPLRGVFEQMGATVNWNPSTRMVMANRNGSNVKLRIGDRNAGVNGQNVVMDVPAMIIGSSTMVPIRFVSEALGAQVGWMASTQQVNITTTNAGNSTVNTPARKLRRVMVRENTVIPVTLDHTLSTIDSRKGDTFTATVRTDGDEYSTIPRGTKVEGHIAAVHPMKSNSPALLDLAFDKLVFPNGRTVRVDGTLTSLASDNVTKDANGVLVMNPQAKDKDNRMVYAGYGAGAGLLVGILTKKPLEGTVIGGVLGYLLGTQKNSQQAQKVSDITLAPGTEMGVRVNQDVTVSWPDDNSGGR